MEPRLTFFEGRFVVVRPLIYLSAVEIARYARARDWRFPPELECPQGEEARRGHIEAFLASFPKREREQMRANLWRAAREGGHGEA
jgi:tRNA(Ile)-lysidine synthase TilS/MesJ